MPLVSNLQRQDYQFEHSLPEGKWRWTTRLDVSKSNPEYSIRDIVSPFGLLRDSIPLPGAVVEAMAESIEELQANFSPNILVGPPTSLSFEVDEGRGFSASQSVIITNDGVYGSILGVTITSSASYVRSVPANIGNLSINESGQFDVDVDSTDLLAVNSPYNESLTIQDPGATNSPQAVPVVIVVRPKAEITCTPLLLTFTVTKPLVGDFPAIAPQTFSVQNTGPATSVLEYTVSQLTGLASWLTGIVPSSGTLASGASENVEVTVAPPSNLLQGTYTETLRVAGFSSNSQVDVEIQLVVS